MKLMTKIEIINFYQHERTKTLDFEAVSGDSTFLNIQGALGTAEMLNLPI